MALTVPSSDPQDLANPPAINLVPPGPPEGIGKAVAIGAVAGFFGIGGLVLLGGWAGGMPAGSAAAFGGFVGAWGGAGFGAMVGGVTAASRVIDAERGHH